ncbi:MAG: ice-binding family protein [Candidatus Saccharimonadales bacterium]
MKLLKTLGIISLLVASTFVAPTASAATSPGLGAANTFTVLSGSYVNTTPGTTISGDLGYTTGPATAPTVGGTTHIADGTYNQAGIDQGNALSFLNSQPCTYNFPAGPTDLATDVTHGPVGVYTPGVYCLTGAANVVSSGTITLDGAGTYIFRMDGALTTGANSIITAINGASACNVWWTPTQATSLGANSTFLGTDIDAAGITIGDNVTWEGQALAFGGTVTTDNDTLTSPTCDASRSETPSAPTTTPGLPNTGIGSSAVGLSVAGIFAILGGLAVTILAVYKKQRSL